MDDDLEAYGRVTDPGRYGVVLVAARELITELVATYVAVAEHLDDERTTVTPASEGAAPLTFHFTPFPSVHLSLGRWRSEGFPSCGCDHCDEQPDQAVARMREIVSWVADGRFTEGWDGDRLSYTLGPFSRGWSLVQRPEHVAALGTPAEVRWRPWPRRVRPPGASG